MTAAERREEILDAAMSEFAIKGLHGTSTETIARRAGVSQPYLFRLFGTKKDLFLAAVERGFDRVSEIFRIAVAANPENPLESMGQAYGANLLPHREQLLLQMQSYVACADPDVQALVRNRFAGLFRLIESLAGASQEEVTNFLAYGMLLNVAAAMNLAEVFDKEAWVRRCLNPAP